MNLKTKAKHCVDALEQAYPDAICSLEYRDPYHLLVSVRLAAQCTDARVNLVTPHLFDRYPDMYAMAAANVEDIEEIVKPCGLYKTKARDLKASAEMLVSDFGGRVPDTMGELLKLPGVGRKSANLVLGDIYGKPAVVCDTHCIRITGLLGLSQGKDPTKVEMQLRKVLPMDRANDFCHRLVLHGRAVCIARRPQCSQCVMGQWCDYAQNEKRAKDAKGA